MSKFFSFKLYRQGLKKSRLQGITIAGIVTALTSLIPAVMLLSPTYYEDGYIPPTTMIGYDGFAVPLFLLLLFTPILTLSMFSFLNKRNESDFYHSIPFTRPCVYFSFLSAVMTWVVITLTVSITAATLLWSMVPYTAVPWSIPFVHFIVYFLGALLLTAFTVVAMTLTGTTISNLLIFALLFLFVRVAGALFVACMESIYPTVIINLSFARFLQIDYNIPLGIISPYFFDGDFGVFENYGLWLYTALVSIGLVIAGCWLYTRRHSQMAGQSAPNSTLQHIYRIMVTMPMVFLTVYGVLEAPEFELIVVMGVLTLLVYYVYEIITTKRLKNLLKATLFVPALIVGGILFGLTITLSGNVAVNYTPDADEIKSISIYDPNADRNPTYELMNTTSISIDNPKVLDFVAKELKEMKKTTQEYSAAHYLYPDRYIDKDIYYGDSFSYTENTDYIRWSVKIIGQSGRVCGRTLCLTMEEYLFLNTCFAESEEYEDALLKLPTDKEIVHIDFNAIYVEKSVDRNEIWKSFAKEYNALSLEQKTEYKMQVMRGEWYQYALSVNGMKDSRSFYSTYPLYPDLFPETTRMYMQIANEIENGSFTLALDKLQNSNPAYTSLSVEVGYEYHGFDNQSELIQKAVEFLEGCNNSFEAGSQIVRINFWVEDYEAENYSFSGTKYYILSEEDVFELYSIMGVDGYVDKGEAE